MPFDDKGRIVCITHKDKPMQRQITYTFLTQAEKNRDGGLNILATNGIPLITYICIICGYVENYAAMATKEWSIKSLYVKCKNDKCKREFRSPIQMEEEAFESSQLQDNQYQCYFCKETNTYDKKEHFFK